MFVIVTAANTARIPITTKTTRLCTRATSVEPATFKAVMARTTMTANALTAAVFPSVTMSAA